MLKLAGVIVGVSLKELAGLTAGMVIAGAGIGTAISYKMTNKVKTNVEDVVNIISAEKEAREALEESLLGKINLQQASLGTLSSSVSELTDTVSKLAASNEELQALSKTALQGIATLTEEVKKATAGQATAGQATAGQATAGQATAGQAGAGQAGAGKGKGTAGAAGSSKA